MAMRDVLKWSTQVQLHFFPLLFRFLNELLLTGSSTHDCKIHIRKFSLVSHLTMTTSGTTCPVSSSLLSSAEQFHKVQLGLKKRKKGYSETSVLLFRGISLSTSLTIQKERNHLENKVADDITRIVISTLNIIFEKYNNSLKKIKGKLNF